LGIGFVSLSHSEQDGYRKHGPAGKSAGVRRELGGRINDRISNAFVNRVPTGFDSALRVTLTKAQCTMIPRVRQCCCG